MLPKRCTFLNMRKDFNLLEKPCRFKNVRIALMVRSFEGGGAERVMVTLANKFLEWGYPIDFIVVNDKGPYKKDLGAKANLIVLNNNSENIPAIYGIFFKLLRYFQRTPPSVMLSTPKRTNIIAVVVKLCSFKKFPLFVREATTLDWFFVEGGLKNRLLLSTMRLLYPYSTKVLANSNITKSDLLQKLKVDAEKVHVIYNPVDLSKINCKAKVTSSHSHKIVVGCGRLYPSKNFGDLIKSFPCVLNRYPDAQLLVLGEGVERGRLQEHIETLQIAESVHLLGFVENPYKYFAMADVFVQTSLVEGFGYVLAEAMACGTPVIAYDSKGAMREILENGKYGKLVHVGDIKALGCAIIDQIEKPTSKRLLHEAVTRFDVNIISKQYLNTMLQAHGEMCPDHGN